MQNPRLPTEEKLKKSSEKQKRKRLIIEDEGIKYRLKETKPPQINRWKLKYCIENFTHKEILINCESKYNNRGRWD